MKTAKELALMAARALSDKKGREIQVLEIGDLTTLADYFVIATGSSNTQINALVDNVEKVLREEAQEEPLHREGYRAGTWVLLDYGCIAIHVFNAEARVAFMAWSACGATGEAPGPDPAWWIDSHEAGCRSTAKALRDPGGAAGRVLHL